MFRFRTDRHRCTLPQRAATLSPPRFSRRELWFVWVPLPCCACYCSEIVRVVRHWRLQLLHRNNSSSCSCMSRQVLLELVGCPVPLLLLLLLLPLVGAVFPLLFSQPCSRLLLSSRKELVLEQHRRNSNCWVRPPPERSLPLRLFETPPIWTPQPLTSYTHHLMAVRQQWIVG